MVKITILFMFQKREEICDRFCDEAKDQTPALLDLFSPYTTYNNPFLEK
jgi:hypothetical protein